MALLVTVPLNSRGRGASSNPGSKITADAVGEADEGDSPMAGIELGAGEVELAKMREQVATMVAERPKVAAGLVSRWLEESN